MATGDDIGPEVDRISGDILDGRVPSSDAPPAQTTAPAAPAAAAPAASAESEAIRRAWFVHRMAAGEGLLPPDADQHLASPPSPPPAGRPVLPPEGPDGGLAEMVSRNLNRAVLEAPEGATLKTRHLSKGVVAVFAFVALALFLGALIQLQAGGGSATPGSSAVAAASVAPSWTGPAPSMAEPSPTDAEPSAEPSPSDPAPSDAAPSPTSVPSATPASTALRGTINVKAITSTGMKVGTNEVELFVDEDTGKVTGSFAFSIENFPIGALLTQAFGGANDPDYAKFKTCSVRMVMAAKVTGTWSSSSGKLKGIALFTPSPEDVHDCLKTRPANVSVNRATKPSKVTWSGTYRGTRASGKLELEPALPWSATQG